MASRSTVKRVGIGAAIVVVILVILIALLPAMMSWGLGHGMIRSSIEKQINGSADFQDVSLTWFGPQSISSVELVDDTGTQAAMLDVTVREGLLRLLLGSASLNASISGTLSGELYEDGTVSFQRLLIEKPETDEPLNLEGVPSLSLTLHDLTATVDDVTSGRRYVFGDVRGDMVYVPGSDLRFDLNSPTEVGGTHGSITASGSAPRLFNTQGRLTPNGVPVNVDVAIQSLPVPGVDLDSELQSVQLSAQSENLATSLALAMNGQGTVEDEQPSSFSGEFRIRNPIQQDGTIDVDLQRIQGQLTGERVPVSLLQPALNDTPIVLTRDLGRTANIELQLDESADGMMFLRAVGEQAVVELTAMQQDGWWIGDNLVLQTDAAHPDLVQGYTGITVEQPTDLEITLTSFAVPPVNESLDARPWGRAGATGSIHVNGPTTIVVAREDGTADDAQPRRFELSRAAVNVETAALGDALYLTGSMSIDGGEVVIDQFVSDLADDTGRIELANALPVGTIDLHDMPSTTAAQWLPQDQAEMLHELLGDSFSADVRTIASDQGLQAQVNASAPSAQLSATALRTPEALQLEAAQAALTLSPELASTLLRDAMDDPVQLTQPANVVLRLDPVSFPGEGPFDYAFAETPLSGELSAERMMLGNVPGLDRDVGVANMQATLHAQQLEQWSFGGIGQADIVSEIGGRALALLEYDITATAHDAQPLQIRGDVNLTEIETGQVERLMDQDAGTFEQWVGSGGDIRAQLATINNGYEATVNTQLQRMQGAFAASMQDRIVSVKTDNVQMNVAQTALEDLLSAENQAAAVDVLNDVPMTLTLQSRFPISLFTQEPYDPQDVSLDAQLQSDPLSLAGDSQQSTLNNIVIAARSEVVEDGVDFVITVDADIEQATPDAGEIALSARVADLLMSGQGFSYDTARLDVDADIVQGPSALADALMNMHGYFVSAVGYEMDAVVNANNLSREGGSLAVDLTAPHGWLRLNGTGSDGLLVFEEGSPIEGELKVTELLRDGILGNLHPLLGDILTAEQPMHLLVSNATVPLDGDISRLNATINLSLGDVRFNPQSPMFSLLRMARVREVSELAGNIAPIRMHIENGVIRYDEFEVTVDQLVMAYQGQIDLNTRSLQLRTSLPLGELLVSGIREVPEEAQGIQVPIVTRGSFSDMQTAIDPEFDLARALLEAGVQRGIEDIIPRDRLPFDLRDLFPR